MRDHDDTTWYSRAHQPHITPESGGDQLVGEPRDVTRVSSLVDATRPLQAPRVRYLLLRCHDMETLTACARATLRVARAFYG